MLQTLWIKFKKPRYEHDINQTVVTLNPAFFYDLRFLCNCTFKFFFLFQKVLYSLIKDFFFLMDYVKILLTKLMDNGNNLLPKYDCKHISFLSKFFFKTLLWLFALYYIFFLSSLLTHSIHNYYKCHHFCFFSYLPLFLACSIIDKEYL